MSVYQQYLKASENARKNMVLKDPFAAWSSLLSYSQVLFANSNKLVRAAISAASNTAEHNIAKVSNPLAFFVSWLSHSIVRRYGQLETVLSASTIGQLLPMLLVSLHQMNLSVEQRGSLLSRLLELCPALDRLGHLLPSCKRAEDLLLSRVKPDPVVLESEHPLSDALFFFFFVFCFCFQPRIALKNIYRISVDVSERKTYHLQIPHAVVLNVKFDELKLSSG